MDFANVTLLVALLCLLLDPAVVAAAEDSVPVQTRESESRQAETAAVNSGVESAEEEGVDEEREVAVSLDMLGIGGWSSAGTAALPGLNGGGHDPQRSGLTLQQVELTAGGKLSRWLDGDVHVVRSDTELELEEAYLTSRGDERAKLKGGLFLTRFGLANHRHPDAWQWVDQNLAITRMFGGDGSRSFGLQASLELARKAECEPDRWRSTLYLAGQQADDESMVSFRGSEGGGSPGIDPLPADADLLAARYGDLTVGNRPLDPALSAHGLVWSARWENSWQPDCASRWQLGLSAMQGPNATGPSARTTLCGADLSYKWQPDPECRWPFVLWESEYLQRRYAAAAWRDHTEPAQLIDLPAAPLRDHAWYTQAVYGFRRRWAAGLRIEQAGGSGESIGGRASDPLRDNRWRLAPLISCWPQEGVHLRLQYNRDLAQHLGTGGANGSASSLWFSAEWSIGKEHESPVDEEFSVPGEGPEEVATASEDGNGKEGSDER